MSKDKPAVAANPTSATAPVVSAPASPPSAGDEQSDATLAAKDAEIAELRAQLAAAQAPPPPTADVEAEREVARLRAHVAELEERNRAISTGLRAATTPEPSASLPPTPFHAPQVVTYNETGENAPLRIRNPGPNPRHYWAGGLVAPGQVVDVPVQFRAALRKEIASGRHSGGVNPKTGEAYPASIEVATGQAVVPLAEMIRIEEERLKASA